MKFKDYTHIIKVSFKDTKMAKIPLEKGILAFNMRIAPEQIEKEFINI